MPGLLISLRIAIFTGGRGKGVLQDYFSVWKKYFKFKKLVGCRGAPELELLASPHVC